MDTCERRFGGLLCPEVGEGICAFALNDAWPNGGDIRDSKPIVEMLTQAGFTYAAKVYLLHSYEDITDQEVKRFLHPTYATCVARAEIAEMAKRALEILTEDEPPDPDTLGRIVFRIDQ